MNKVWKKAGVLLAVAAVLTMAGCGGQTKEGKTEGQTAKLGFVTAYTGPGAAYGTAMKEGVELAVAEINSNPNTKIKLDLTTYDTKLDKNEAINAMKRVITKDNVLCVVGPMTSGEMFAAGPIAQQYQTVAFGTGTTAPGITDIGDYIFRNAVPGKTAIPVTVKKAHDILGFKRVAMLYSHNNDHAVGENETFQKVFKELGLDVVATETFADKDTDFAAQLTKIQATNPDVIAVAGLYQEGALIMKKMREMGMNQPVLGNNGFNSPEFLKLAGSAADNVMVATPWNPNRQTEKAKHFKEAYAKAYGHEPDQFAAQAYDAVLMIHQAIEEANTTTDRKKFRDTLAAIKGFEGATGAFFFDEHRDPMMDMDVLTAKNGQWTTLEK